ncbi:MAG: hypothetical protein Q8N23_08800 [Archangium sp.]|nr:hypothetical protein [Archangium sp.]MDP3152755.1 hypothetical protein [Archangium sp.]MDP3573542.1 hypothetical protein [Archangium sp.]
MNVRLALVWSALGFATVTWAVPIAPPPPEVFPRNAAVVPSNTKIWVFGDNNFVQVSGPQGTEVAVTTVSIRGLFGQGVTQLTPRAALAPGAYEVRQFGDKLVTFNVTAEVDTTPPGAPQVVVSSTGKVGQMSSLTTITSADADSFLVVLDEGQTWQPTTVVAASLAGSVSIVGLRAGETRLQALRVDAAGNASEVTDVVATTPADRSCSVAPVLPLVLLASTLFRRRRVPSAQ